MKKTVACLLAVLMIAVCSVPVLAATVTVPESLAGHAFKAYQIFAGTQARPNTGSNDNAALGDVVWGSGISSSEFLAALQADDTFLQEGSNLFAACETAQEVAQVLSSFAGSGEKANRFAKLAALHLRGAGTPLTAGDHTLPDGYYLIADVSTFAPDATDQVYNPALLQVTGDITIHEKYDRTDVQKEVQDNETENWGQTADSSIGDQVPFRFCSAVPDLTHYDHYELIYHDTMSAGLTFCNDLTVSLYRGDTLVKALSAETDFLLETDGLTGETFRLTIRDLKAVEGAQKGDRLVVDYHALLNDQAVLGKEGNPNEVYLEYDNNPNGEGKGKTEKKTAVVFTYGLDVTKVDGKDPGQKLKDAEFVFYRLTPAGKKAYVQVDDACSVQGWTERLEEAKRFVTPEGGQFSLHGLDDGVYYLEETRAPAGYNLLANPITVEVKALRDDLTQTLTRLEITAGGKTDAGSLDTGRVGVQVQNKKGAVLPETGALGTLLFSVVGGTVLIAALVLLITRKKMSVYKK